MLRRIAAFTADGRPRAGLLRFRSGDEQLQLLLEYQPVFPDVAGQLQRFRGLDEVHFERQNPTSDTMYRLAQRQDDDEHLAGPRHDERPLAVYLLGLSSRAHSGEGGKKAKEGK